MAFRSIVCFLVSEWVWNVKKEELRTELDLSWVEYNVSCRVTSVTLSLGIKISFFTLIFVGAPTSDWTLCLLVTARRNPTWRGQSLCQAMAITASLEVIQNPFLILLLHYTMSNTSSSKHMLLFVRVQIKFDPDISLACLTSCLTCSSNNQYLGNQWQQSSQFYKWHWCSKCRNSFRLHYSSHQQDFWINLV